MKKTKEMCHFLSPPESKILGPATQQKVASCLSVELSDNNVDVVHRAPENVAGYRTLP